MPRLVVFVAVLAATLTGAAFQVQPKADVAGIYRCEGTNPDGTAYQGVVEIAAVEKTYLVRWTLADVQVMGVGIRNGETLSVSYFGGAPAVVVYTIAGDRLDGEWTMGGAEGMIYSETLTRMQHGERPPAGVRPREGERQRKPARTRPVTPVREL